MSIGHFVLAIENEIAFFLALAFIVVGNGFFKPNISTFVVTLPEGSRKDSGFTIFYIGINIGAFASPLLCGWLGETYGWHYGWLSWYWYADRFGVSGWYKECFW